MNIVPIFETFSKSKKVNTERVVTTKKNFCSSIQKIESKFFQEKRNEKIIVGNIIRLGYKIKEGTKERIQFYEGLILSKKNIGLGQSFTLRRTVQGIGVEQIFSVHSPKIVSITHKQSFQIRRAKLYFLRSLTGKAAKLQVKI